LKVPVRVYYQDTDAGGVVFHAQYFASWSARAASSSTRSDRSRLARRRAGRVLFLVHELTARYHAPARLNDMLSVSAEVVKMGPPAWCSATGWNVRPELLVEAEVTLALVTGDRMRPARMPEELKQAFK